MEIRNIYYYPNPILNQSCEKVTIFDDQLKKLVSDMKATTKYYNGCGLAAPQIGINKCLFVVVYQGRELAIINPQVISKEGSERLEEGCLSIPNVSIEVDRATQITLSAQNENGESVLLEESGFFARIIQHEYDHIIGKFILDYQEK